MTVPTPLPAAAAPTPETADLYAPHGRTGHFFNPWGPRPHGFGAVLDWWLSPNPYDKPARPDVPT